MTHLMMHWRLAQGADGKRHLDMVWKSGHTCVIAGYSRPKSQPGVKHK